VFTRDIKGYVTLEQPGLIEGGVGRVGWSSWEKEGSGKAVEVKEFIPFNGTVDHTIFLRGTSTLSGSVREPRHTGSMLFRVSPVIPSILLFDVPLNVSDLMELISITQSLNQVVRDWMEQSGQGETEDDKMEWR